MHTPTIKPNLAITLHADESVSFWNPIAQRWERTCVLPSDEVLAALDDDERVRMALFLLADDIDGDTVNDALALPRIPWALLDRAGLDISDIADDARWRGDETLHRRALAYLRRAA